MKLFTLLRIGAALLAPSVALPTGAAAAAPSGVITGVVLNLATNDLLAGARLQVEGTPGETSSERGGSFTLAAPAGPRTLIISFAGLETKRVAVLVPAGGEVAVEVSLTAAIYQLDKFTVSGLREGQALAIQLQSQADHAKTVAATDTFGNPAANPGELLMRLPGVAVNFV